MEILLFILIGLIIFLNSYLDFRAIKRNVFIDHFENVIIVGCLMLILLLTFIWYGAISALFFVQVAVVIPAIRWILHDVFLNLMRGLSLFYIAEPSDKSALTDNFLHFMQGVGIHIVFVKLFALCISVLLSYFVVPLIV